MVEFTSVLCVCFECRSFGPAPPLFAARMIKCSEPNLTGGFPTPFRFTLRGGETYYARYSFRQSIVRAGLDHTLSVATVCRMISPAGAGGREVCVEKYYWAESGVSRFRSCALRRRRRRSARSSPLRAAALRSSRAIRPDRDPRSRNIPRSRSRKPLRAG